MSANTTLRAIFDDKIIRVLNALMDQPSKSLSLTQIATQADVSTATTLRILSKLVKQEFARVSIIGKSKYYKLKQNQKTRELGKIIRKNEAISHFTTPVEQIPEISKIILVAKEEKKARIILVGDNIPKDAIKKIATIVKDKHKFLVDYIELSTKQFDDLSKIGVSDISDKVIWER